jgi:hypothetical protein
MQIKNLVVDFNLGASSSRGSGFLRIEQAMMKQLLRIEGNRIDHSCTNGSKAAYGSAWARDEQAANRVANLIKQSGGRSIQQIWDIDLPIE